MLGFKDIFQLLCFKNATNASIFIFFSFFFQPIYNFKDLSNNDFCDPLGKPRIKGDAVAIARGNCTFTEKARVVQMYEGEAALIVSRDYLVSKHFL